jgi:hypothetical protein
VFQTFKKGGLIFITLTNVESITSTMLFLYTGSLLAFTPDHTLRPAHIMPIFKWKLDLALAEARFEYASGKVTIANRFISEKISIIKLEVLWRE